MKDNLSKIPTVSEAHGQTAVQVDSTASSSTREKVNSTLINALTTKEPPFQLLNFQDAKPEVKLLPGQTRILKIEAPTPDLLRLQAVLEQSDLARPVSLTPTVRNPEDRVVSVQTLITNESSLPFLQERAISEKLALNYYLSEKNIPVLQVNGAIGAISSSLHEESSRKNVTLDAQANALTPWPMSIRPFERTLSVPRLGPCSYLVFDVNILKSPDLRFYDRILEHLELLARSPDFHFTFDQFGNLVIIALNERAIGVLSRWANSLQNLTMSQAHLFIGKGEIVTSNPTDLSIKGYFPRTDLDVFRSVGVQRPSLYTTDSVLNKIKGSRDETLSTLSVEDRVSGFVSLEVKKKVTLNVGGGPDRLVGYREEFVDMQEALHPDNPTRLIFLEGNAGTGKSRLIHETTKRYDNKLVISMDPAGRNIPGYSLVNMADQMATYMLEKQEGIAEKDLPSRVKSFLIFAHKNDNEKLLEVNRDPYIVSAYLQETLHFFEENFGGMVVVIDDVHHIDRYSDSYIMGIVREMAESAETDGIPGSKFILARRPEKRYVSIHQDNLKQRIAGCKTISLHQEDGSPKLDFSNPEIAKEYILYSLPEEKRLNREDDTPKILGEWAEVLGDMVKTPFEMTAFMQEILSNPDYLLIQKDRIDLSNNGLERMEKIQGQDMKIYYLEKIGKLEKEDPSKEQLSPHARGMLQAFALVGNKMSEEQDLIAFLCSIFKLGQQEVEAYLLELHKKGFLKTQEKVDEKKGTTEVHYFIWHENIRDIVLNYTMDEATRADLATRVFQSIQHFKKISSQQRFAILHYAANTKEEEDMDFWNNYAMSSQRSLMLSEKNNLYGQGYAVASMILAELDLERASPNVILVAVRKLMEGQEVPNVISELVVKALRSLVENGLYLGRFTSVYKAIETAEKIQAANPGLGIDLFGFYKVGFETAYAQINTKKLAEYVGKIDRKRLTALEIVLMGLKYAYRKGDLKQCQQILHSLKGKKGLYPEVERLRIRIEMMDLLNDLTAKGIDGDAQWSGLDLSPEHLQKVKDLDKDLEDLKVTLDNLKNYDGTPKRLSPIDELHMLDLESQIKALTGKYAESARSFGESWRVAMQMEIYPEAVRAAKQKGDMEVIGALKIARDLLEKAERKISAAGKLPGHGHATHPHLHSRVDHNIYYRQALKGSIQTYSEDGIDVAERSENSYYKFLLCVQRLRALCMLISTFALSETTVLEDDLKKFFIMGLKDMIFINQSPWCDYVPKELDVKTDIKEFETCYYITPIVLWFKELCEKHGYVLPEMDLPYESEVAVDGTALMANMFEIYKLGENNRKLEAIFRYREKFKSIDDYIQTFPEEIRGKLQQVRDIIQNAVTEAKEAVSKMPTFKLNGKMLAAFATKNRHIEFFVTPSEIKVFEGELSGYFISKNAIQFPVDMEIPESLIQRILLFREKEIN